ncbi:hypothetical protein ACOSP7_016641 [Xanthoceras sorbifolium]
MAGLFSPTFLKRYPNLVFIFTRLNNAALSETLLLIPAVSAVVVPSRSQPRPSGSLSSQTLHGVGNESRVKSEAASRVRSGYYYRIIKEESNLVESQKEFAGAASIWSIDCIGCVFRHLR